MLSSPSGANGIPPELSSSPAPPSSGPSILGLPLKYVSLLTLAIQNAALSIVMHYSRVSTPPHLSYSPASAVLMCELLKGSISLLIAIHRAHELQTISSSRRSSTLEVFSHDCWKLSIPAILYVVQNSLQFVAVGNLPVASFQVAYQMKILTTAAFSVAMLRKRLTGTKWLSLLFLAIGVAIVQVQTTATNSSTGGAAAKAVKAAVGSAEENSPVHHVHVMNPVKGFGAVTAACFTSGLAGVYFEMVLKGSKADLWVRNVQLSLFSLVPCILPILYNRPSAAAAAAAAAAAHLGGPAASTGVIGGLLRNFGGWAWATVIIQVLGGLITAVVIKYSDNILKGFATSLSIVLSFLASVALFHFRITPSFVIGASTVLAATWMYNQPEQASAHAAAGTSVSGKDGEQYVLAGVKGGMGGGKGSGSFFPETPVGPDDPIIGHIAPGSSAKRKSGSPFGSPRALASALLGDGSESSKDDRREREHYFAQTEATSRYLHAPYGSPFPSRTPTPGPPEGEHHRM
ncbi:hypothetical protein CONPUDRAFT_116926 [Coniophora puteana RWD-64-598 SS2]|uniref:Nucleotide-sugar transporter n=1 Tax=Coniophora puteana (strain RWD-64-598) TaxID=741705 RepID=A0A5M3N0F7_CONPW|nr:uncharacterized protein CONPUDRAFT_116926 [Coniophora puteana RWD-64-598 SS2]EIW84756.1 hypothetical protein CONPUDRAFT_116926 [Coniophora puteana RWD-64-598 SS2]